MKKFILLAIVMLWTFVCLLVLSSTATANPTIKTNSWINGKFKKHPVSVYWFLDPNQSSDTGIEAMRAVREEHDGNPDIGFVLLTNYQIRPIKPWLASYNLTDFTVGCSIGIATLRNFSIPGFSTVIVMDPKGKVTWRGGSGNGELASEINDALRTYQKKALSKVEKSEKKAQKAVGKHEYSKAYEIYYKAYKQISLLDYAEDIKEEMTNLEGKVIDEYNALMFGLDKIKAKSILAKIKSLMKKVEGSSLQVKLEQRVNKIEAVLKDNSSLCALHMAYAHRLLSDAKFDVVYSGLTRMLGVAQKDEHLAAEILNAMSKIEKIVASRISFLIENKNPDQDKYVAQLNEYFADTPMSDKIAVWIKESEKLKTITEFQPKTKELPKLITDFSGFAEEVNYSEIPMEDLIKQAKEIYNNGKQTIKDLAPDNPKFKELLEESLENFRKASQMYSTIIERSNGPFRKYIKKLEATRKQIFLCRQMMNPESED